MSTTTQVQKIKLNKMTKARYDEITPVATELYMLTDVLDSSYDELPTADVKYVGQITQYTGTTTSTLTNGYFYKCVSDGAATPSYSWERTDVQPSGSSGGVSDVTVNGTSVVSGGVAAITVPTATSDLTNDSGFATIDDTSTTSTTATWSASKLNTMIGNIESLINAL